jgi:hypothetical protein
VNARKDIRTRELGAIHAARRDLMLDESEYRNLLWAVARVRSAADLDQAGRRKVLDHLRSRGAARTPRKRVAQHPGTPHNIDLQPMLTKIEAQLADMGLPWSYADAIGRRQTGIPRLAWVRKPDQLSGVIAALEKEQQKRGRLESVDALLAQLGRNRAYIDALLPAGYRRDWKRDLDMLGRIVALLDAQQPASTGDGASAE